MVSDAYGMKYNKQKHNSAMSNNGNKNKSYTILSLNAQALMVRTIVMQARLTYYQDTIVGQ